MVSPRILPRGAERRQREERPHVRSYLLWHRVCPDAALAVRLAEVVEDAGGETPFGLREGPGGHVPPSLLQPVKLRLIGVFPPYPVVRGGDLLRHGSAAQEDAAPNGEGEAQYQRQPGGVRVQK